MISIQRNERQQDVIALLVNATMELHLFHKELIKPDLNKKYHHLSKQSMLPTQWLFGNEPSKMDRELDEE